MLGTLLASKMLLHFPVPCSALRTGFVGLLSYLVGSFRIAAHCGKYCCSFSCVNLKDMGEHKLLLIDPFVYNGVLTHPEWLAAA